MKVNHEMDRAQDLFKTHQNLSPPRRPPSGYVSYMLAETAAALLSSPKRSTHPESIRVHSLLFNGVGV